jgi:hypothetical protein
MAGEISCPAFFDFSRRSSKQIKTFATSGAYLLLIRPKRISNPVGAAYSVHFQTMSLVTELQSLWTFKTAKISALTGLQENDPVKSRASFRHGRRPMFFAGSAREDIVFHARHHQLAGQKSCVDSNMPTFSK